MLKVKISRCFKDVPTHRTSNGRRIAASLQHDGPGHRGAPAISDLHGQFLESPGCARGFLFHGQLLSQLDGTRAERPVMRPELGEGEEKSISVTLGELRKGT